MIRLLRTYLIAIFSAVMLLSAPAEVLAASSASSSAASLLGSYGVHKGDSILPLGIRYTKEHPLIIVADWLFQPYTFCNDKAEPDGLLIELIQGIFNQLHVPYEIRMTNYKEARRMLYNGTAHLMMDVKKPSEMRGVHYGKSILANYRVGLVRLKTTPSLHSIELIKRGDTIYTNTWKYIDDYLYNYFDKNPNFNVKWLEPHDALDELLLGNIKYYICGRAGIENDLRFFSMQDRITVDDIDVPQGEFHFMSSDVNLLNELDNQFERLKASGRYQPLVDKWLSDDDKYDAGTTPIDILAIVGIILLFVGAITASFFTMRSGNSGNLKREFKAIAHMSITLTDCNVFAINVRRQWVYNVSGNVLPRQGLSMADYEGLIHPDDLHVVLNAVERVDGGAKQMPSISFRMKRYGDTTNDWRQMKVNAFIKLDKKDMPVYVYLALHDETDSLREQRMLDIQLKEFSHVTEITECGMAYYDANGNFSNCNSTMINIFDKGGVGKGEQYVKSTNREILKMIFNGLTLGVGESAWFCSPVDLPELNLHLMLEVRINTVRSDDGRYQGFSLSILDLTEQLEMRHREAAVNRKMLHNERDLYRYRKEMEFALREKETLNNKFHQVEQQLKEQTKVANDAVRQKTIFLANMTHELRTPLNLINGFAEVMQVGATMEEKEQYFSIMQHNCTMLINIIDNILNLSTIDAEGVTIRTLRTDFAKDFAVHASEMRKYINSPKVEYIVEKPLNTLDLEVDTDHIMMILDAFVNNAAKNTREGTIRVGFTYDKSNSQLVVYCQDTGCGIPADKQGEIFDCFTKVNPFVPGTGIGLYLCRLIADAMNATIDVESKEGEGSTFTLNVRV